MSDNRAMSSRTRNFVDQTFGSLMFIRIVYLQFVVQFNAPCLLYRIFEGVVLIFVVIVFNRSWRRCFWLLRHAYNFPLFTSAASGTVTPSAASGLYTTAARARTRFMYRTPNVCRRHVNVASVSVTPAREQFYHISAREVLVS